MRCKLFFTIMWFIAIIAVFPGCSQKAADADSDTLLPGIRTGNFVEGKTNLSDIIGEYSVIPLETTEESLIGGFSIKTIKKDGHFFVKSNNEVLMFDETGKFQCKLSRVGGGPEEYENISDFDIVPEYGEIWVSGNKRISRYKYPSMEYNGHIALDFFASQFKYLGRDTFIADTPEEVVYKIVSIDGKVLQEFYDKDLANSASFPVQFVETGCDVATQLGDSNSAVCYDPKTGSFSIKDILPPENDHLATTEINRKYFDMYGYFDFNDKVLQDYATVGWFRRHGDQALVAMKYPGEQGMEQAVIFKDGERVNEYIVWPEDKSMVRDDIFGSSSTRFLVTFGSCESDDSFIFIVADEDDDANPSLLEVRKL